MGGILRRPVFHLVLIALLGLLIYSNTFDVPFYFDDVRLIVDNPFIKDFSYFAEPSRADSVRHMEGRDTLHYFKTRYVGFLTLWANYKLHGLEVEGYHSINLILHTINTVLVYLLVMLTFRTPLMSGSRLEGSSWGIALISGLFFVAHPLQTEGVTYILSRFVLLTAMFYMITLVLYIKARQSSIAAEQKEKKSFAALPLYCSAILCCVLAMKTKENAFTLPVAIALFEALFFSGGVKKRAVYIVPFLITMLIIPLTYMGLNAGAGGFESAFEGSTKLGGAPPRLDYFLTQLRVIVGYIGLLMFPAGQNADHNQQIFHSFLTPQVFLSFLSLLSIFGLGVYFLYRSRITDSGLRLITFGIFWFFLALSVESSVLPIGEIMVEYRVYLPSVGFHIATAAGIFLLISKIRNKAPVYVSIVLVLLVLASATYARNTVWKSEIAMWEDSVEKSPDKSRPHHNLGAAYQSRGMIKKAIEHYRTAAELEPRDPTSYYNLGIIYQTRGLMDNAIQLYLIALEVAPNYAEAHNNLGLAYRSKGMIDKAIEHYRIALRLVPDYAQAHYNLGLVYSQKGLEEEARGEFEAALRIDPDYSRARESLEGLNKKE
jgi:tetratricopeptide (TPR) repeat protein